MFCCWSIRPLEGGLLGGGGWWPIVLLAVFNLFDTLGRSVPAVPALQYVPAAALPAAVAARAAFTVLLVGCARRWPGFGDAAALAAAAAFALTNGHYASVAFMVAPATVAPHERHTVGTLLSLALNLGIVAGSNAAFAFTAV